MCKGVGEGDDGELGIGERKRESALHTRRKSTQQPEHRLRSPLTARGKENDIKREEEAA
jgi:hypothetical protein